MLLRIYISEANVRRVQLLEVPKSVDHLKTLLEEKLQLKKGFDLQFEDPDFGNALCNLYSIDELPAEKAVLKVIWEIEPSPAQDISDETDAEDHYTKDVQIGILSVMKDNVAAATSLPEVTNIAIILEEAVVLWDIVDLPAAPAYLFGLL
ncbi:hypothetical protein MHYP_G00363470 [Metynnis hypsauchen]